MRSFRSNKGVRPATVIHSDVADIFNDCKLVRLNVRRRHVTRHDRILQMLCRLRSCADGMITAKELSTLNILIVRRHQNDALDFLTACGARAGRTDRGEGVQGKEGGNPLKLSKK